MRLRGPQVIEAGRKIPVLLSWKINNADSLMLSWKEGLCLRKVMS